MKKSIIIIVSVMLVSYLIAIISIAKTGGKINVGYIFEKNHIEHTSRIEIPEELIKVKIDTDIENIEYKNILGKEIEVNLKGTGWLGFEKKLKVTEADNVITIKTYNTDIFLDMFKDFKLEIWIPEKYKEMVEEA
ncbi:MAG: hypothetical protein N4A47_05900 [Clostridia bacterium]|jgi:hypothetical protein|nr:hypothetical protein [Clostridia bacterium]